MKKIFKSFLSVTLCLMMLFGSVAVGGEGVADLFEMLTAPLAVNASAADNEIDWDSYPVYYVSTWSDFEAYLTGDENKRIVLSEDLAIMSLSHYVNINADVSVDMNGHSIVIRVSDNCDISFVAAAFGNFRLYNSKKSATSTLSVTGKESIIFLNTAKSTKPSVDITDITFTDKTTVYSNSTVTVRNCRFLAEDNHLARDKTPDSSLLVDNCVFEGNQSISDAVFQKCIFNGDVVCPMSESTSTAVDCSFYGKVQIWSTIPTRFDGCLFSSDSEKININDNAKAIFENCRIIEQMVVNGTADIYESTVNKSITVYSDGTLNAHGGSYIHIDNNGTANLYDGTFSAVDNTEFLTLYGGTLKNFVYTPTTEYRKASYFMMYGGTLYGGLPVECYDYFLGNTRFYYANEYLDWTKPRTYTIEVFGGTIYDQYEPNQSLYDSYYSYGSIWAKNYVYDTYMNNYYVIGIHGGEFKNGLTLWGGRGQLKGMSLNIDGGKFYSDNKFGKGIVLDQFNTNERFEPSNKRYGWDADSRTEILDINIGNCYIQGGFRYYTCAIDCHVDKYTPDEPKMYCDTTFDVEPDGRGLWSMFDFSNCYTKIGNDDTLYNPGSVTKTKIENEQVPHVSQREINGDIRMYKKNGITVEFNPNGGTVEPKTAKATNRQEIGDLPVPVKEGYDFEYWYLIEDDGSIGRVSATSVCDVDGGNLRLYAKWKPQTKEIKLDYADGRTAKITVTYGSEIVNLPTPTRTGYVFKNWYYKKTDENGKVKKIPVTGKTVFTSQFRILFAEWTVPKVTIDLVCYGGGTFEDGNTVYTIEGDYGTTPKLPTPVKPGYILSGWMDKMGRPVSTIVLNDYKNVQSYRTIWSEANPVLDYTSFPTLHPKESWTTQYTDPQAANPDIYLPEEEWCKCDKDGNLIGSTWFSGNEAASYSKAGNYYTCRITLVTNGTFSSNDEITLNGSNAFFRNKSISKTFKNSDTITVLTKPLYCDYEMVTLTICDEDNVTGYDGTQFEVPARYDLSTLDIQWPELPELTGYARGGWYIKIGNTKQFVKTYNSSLYPINSPAVAEDSLIYPQYTPVNVTVRLHDGDDIDNRTVRFGETFGTRIDKIRDGLSQEGKSFAGWYTGENGTGTLITSSTIIDSPYGYDLYAYWEPTVFAIAAVQSQKTEYYVGDTFISMGTTVTLLYSNDTMETVREGLTFSEPDMTTPGAKTVTVSYEGVENSFIIYVHELTSISVKQMPDTLVYYPGCSLDLTGLVLNLTTVCTGTETVEYSYDQLAGDITINEPDMTTPGIKTVGISYLGQTTGFDINVIELPATDVLTDITITDLPEKTAYIVGDAFDSTGLIVTANYSVSGDIEIGDYDISEPDMTTAGTKTVTVTFGNITKSFDITVADEAPVSIEFLWGSENFVVGETINPESTNILVRMNNGKTEVINSGFTLSPTKLNTAGDQTVTVTYQGLSTTYTVHVAPLTVNSLSIKRMPKTEYFVGDSIDTTGMVLNASFNDYTEEEISSGFTCDVNTFNTAGQQKVTVTYGGCSTELYVSVYEVELTGIAVETEPAKTVYFRGDVFDPAGLTVRLYYNNSTSQVISEGFDVIAPDMNNYYSAGVTVKYNDMETGFSIVLLSENVTKLEIVSNPDKTEYYVGEKVDMTGLKIKLTFESGTTTELTTGFGYDVIDTEIVGEQTIRVFYVGAEDSFTVTVKPLEAEKIEVADMPAISTYETIQGFYSTGLSIKVTYVGGREEIINSGFTVTPMDDMTVPGTKTIKVTYDGKQTTFTVTAVHTVHDYDTSKWMHDDSKHWHGCTCSDCTARIDTDNHDWEETTVREATLTQTGITRFKCKVCQFEKDVETQKVSAEIRTGKSGTVDWRTKVVISAEASLPQGYRLAIYEGNTLLVKGEPNERVTYEAGEAKAEHTYTIKVIDDNGNVVDGVGKEVKVSVNAGFFKKLAAFFKGLFGSLPTKYFG